MYNNGLVKTFGILFTLVSIYQLSFTFITNKIENNDITFAESKVTTNNPEYFSLKDKFESEYLDSIGNVSILGITSYNDAKGKELNKGLDLKGGINVILQISVKDILKGLSDNSKDPIFLKALDDADLLQKNSNEPYVCLLYTSPSPRDLSTSRMPSSA